MTSNDLDIIVEHLTKSFGSIQALNGIDLRLRKGEFLTIFGPNGAGKTTLLKILSSITKPTTGKAIVAGYDVIKDPQKVRESIGLISHQPYLYESLNAVENISFFASMYAISNSEQRAIEIIKKVGLEGRMYDLVRTYSSGMKQRLAVARAIVHDPKILFLDEPYTGLDQHGSRIFSEMLGALKTNKRTILMTTHNISEGLELSDRVAVINSGKIVLERNTAEVEPSAFRDLYFEKI